MKRDALVGGVSAVAAFGTWGLAPLYWRLVREVPGVELVAHRVVWSVPIVLWLVARRRRLAEIAAVVRERRQFRTLVVTALLVAFNWLLFVWSIQRDLVLEASLGYYVNPLLNVALGALVLRERLSPRQAASVVLAAVGVTWLAVSQGTPPWIALALATTFACYGLLRKRARVDALVGLAVETLVLVPVAVALLAWLCFSGSADFLARPSLAGLVALAGFVTALPLLWFANAARRLRLSTLGFFQYLAPTIQFLLAVLAFGEPFRPERAVAFAWIWAAVLLYAWDSLRAMRRSAPAATLPE